MKNYELYFLKKLGEFNEVEQKFIQYSFQFLNPKDRGQATDLFREATRLSFDAVELKNTILGEIHNVDELESIDLDAKDTLNKLRNNERFESLSFAEKIADLFNLNFEKPWELIETKLNSHFSGETDDELWKEFSAWFYIPEYYYRTALIGVDAAFTRLPDNINKYLQEIKEAFAFGLEKSSISLCRALLEIALLDKLKKNGAFNEGYVTTINLAKEDPLERYITVSFKLDILNDNNKELAHRIRKNADNVLHINNTEFFSVTGLALKTISDTMKIIEQLYRRA